MAGVALFTVIVVSTTFADIVFTDKTELLAIEDDPKLLAASDTHLLIQLGFHCNHLSFFLFLF